MSRFITSSSIVAESPTVAELLKPNLAAVGAERYSIYLAVIFVNICIMFGMLLPDRVAAQALLEEQNCRTIDYVKYCDLVMPDSLCGADERQVYLAATGNVKCIGLIDLPPRIISPSAPTNFMPAMSESGWGELSGTSDASDPNNQGQCASFGNPVRASNGNKVQTELDYLGPGRLPLKLSRTYNSSSAPAALNYGSLGAKWTLGLPELRIWHNNAIDRVVFGFINIREDGQRIRIRRKLDNATGLYYYERENGRSIRIFSDENNDWHILEGTREEKYDALGRIVLRVDHESGEYLTYTYSTSTVRTPYRITHSSGRYLQFVYSGNRLTSVRNPAGQYIYYQHNSRGNLSAVIYPSASGLQEQRLYFYEDTRFPDNLTRIRNEDLKDTLWTYANADRAISSYRPQETDKTSVLSHAFVNGGWETTIKNPLGLESTYRFEERGASETRKLVSVSGAPVGNCAAAFSALTYDSNGYYDVLTDPEGNKTDFDYDAFGLLVQKIQAPNTPDERVTNYQFNAKFRKPELIETENLRIEVTYDSFGRPVQRTETNKSTNGVQGASRNWQFSYTTSNTPQNTHLVTQVVVDGPRADVNDLTTFNFDSQGRLTSEVNALGHATTFGNFGAHGRPQQITSATGMQTNIEYNARGGIARKTESVVSKNIGGSTVTQNRVTTYEYSRVGKVSKITHPDGTFFEFYYDSFDRIFRIDNAKDEMIWFDYDVAGNVTRKRIRHEETTTSWQAVCCTPWGEPEPQLVTTTEWITDNETQYEYDALSRLEKITNGKGQSILYRYNKNDLLRLIENARSHQSTQTYNARNELKQVNQPDGGSTALSYDDNGLVSQVTDPIGVSTNYANSGFGETVTEASPDAGDWTYTYDKTGNVTSAKDARDYTTDYVYDALNRVISIQHPAGSNTIFSYDTDQVGYLHTVTDDSGTTTFERNSAGQLTKKTSVVSGVAMTTQYQYDVGGRVEQAKLPGGTHLYYSFDVASQITRIEASHPSFARRNIVSGVEYKPFGPLSRLVYGDNRARVLDYDSDYQLQQLISGNALQKSYLYDANGNITRITDGLANQLRNYNYDVMDRLNYHTGLDGTHTYTLDDNGNRRRKNSTTDNYTYVAGTNRLATMPGLTLSYDANGNVGRVVAGSPSYDARNRLFNFTANNGVVTNYTYNAFGERVSKTRSAFNQRFVYGGGARLLHERGSEGTIDYIYLNGAPIAIVRGGSIYYVHADHLGRPERLTNTLGQLAWSITANAWSSDSQTGSIPFNMRFPGQYFDGESGLHYNYFRTYDPSTGRYLESDPIGLQGGLNTYGYVGANPLKYIDPLGQDIRVENTTAVNGLHQRIVVDVPEGVLIDGRRYDQFGISFGMSNRDLEMQGCMAAAVDHPEFGKEGPGVVYPDVSDPMTKVAQEFETTPEEDLMVLKYMLEQLGKTGPYNVFCQSCRNYSQKEFMKTKKMVLKSRGYELTRHGYESPEEFNRHGH